MLHPKTTHHATRRLCAALAATALLATAGCGAGGGSPSGKAAEVSALLPPAEPTGVTALPGDSFNTVAWQDVAYAERYRVYWSTKSGVTKANGTPIDVVTSPVTHTGLQNGTSYYYVVTAIGAGGEGPASQQVSASPQAPVPGAPRNLTAEATSNTFRSVTLNWLAPTIPANPVDILRYRIYRSTQPGIVANASSASVIEGSNQTSWIDAVPIDGVTYYYVVTAITVSGESPASAEVSTTATGDSSAGSGSGTTSGGTGGTFNCGEPVACWQDPAAN